MYSKSFSGDGAENYLSLEIFSLKRYGEYWGLCLPCGKYGRLKGNMKKSTAVILF